MLMRCAARGGDPDGFEWEMRFWLVLKDGVYSDGREKAIGECEKVPMMIKWRVDRGKR